MPSLLRLLSKDAISWIMASSRQRMLFGIAFDTTDSRREVVKRAFRDSCQFGLLRALGHVVQREGGATRVPKAPDFESPSATE
jgi:hypothetical protein